jgi:hypothetical protein
LSQYNSLPLSDMSSPFASAAYPPEAGFGLGDAGGRGSSSLPGSQGISVGGSKSSGSPRSASAEQQLIGEALHSFVVRAGPVADALLPCLPCLTLTGCVAACWLGGLHVGLLHPPALALICHHRWPACLPACLPACAPRRTPSGRALPAGRAPLWSTASIGATAAWRGPLAAAAPVAAAQAAPARLHAAGACHTLKASSTTPPSMLTWVGALARCLWRMCGAVEEDMQMLTGQGHRMEVCLPACMHAHLFWKACAPICYPRCARPHPPCLSPPAAYSLPRCQPCPPCRRE